MVSGFQPHSYSRLIDHFIPGGYPDFEEESTTVVEGSYGPAYVRADSPISLEDVSDYFSPSVTEHMSDALRYMSALGSGNARPIRNRFKERWIIFRTLR